MKINNKGFSIIEILVGIFIFSVGLVSIYFLIVSTMRLNEYSKNSIISSNLSREAIELVRNIRDSNYINLYKWNKMPGADYNNLFQTGVYYKIENDYTSSTNNVKIDKILDFGEGQNEITGKMQNYRLCLNSDDFYTYDCNSGNKKTYFYRYIKFDDVKYKSNTTGDELVLKDAIKLTSKVVWYSRGYHEVQLDTILTDFQKQ